MLFTNQYEEMNQWFIQQTYTNTHIHTPAWITI